MSLFRSILYESLHSRSTSSRIDPYSISDIPLLGIYIYIDRELYHVGIDQASGAL